MQGLKSGTAPYGKVALGRDNLGLPESAHTKASCPWAIRSFTCPGQTPWIAIVLSMQSAFPTSREPCPMNCGRGLLKPQMHQSTVLSTFAFTASPPSHMLAVGSPTLLPRLGATIKPKKNHVSNKVRKS